MVFEENIRGMNKKTHNEGGAIRMKDVEPLSIRNGTTTIDDSDVREEIITEDNLNVLIKFIRVNFRNTIIRKLPITNHNVRA